MYLVVDLCSDYKEVKDYNGLKSILVESIGNDILSNYGEYDIVESCFGHMAKMAKETVSLDWIIKLLESYSYKVIDLQQIERDLEDIKQFVGQEKLFDVIIKLVNEVNK